MTMIGFATYGDHAEFITDTANYTKHVEELGISTKHVTLHHIDAAILTQGDLAFGHAAKAAAQQLADRATGFDELLTGAPEWLGGMHEQTGSPEECTAFLIGYSEEAGEFVAYAYASEQGFKPVKVSRWFMPTPWTVRPSGIELRRVRAYVAEAEQSRRDLWPQVEPTWTGRPPMTAPASTEEWVELAQTAREQRCLDDYAQVIVHGQVIHTRLERGAATTTVIHEFSNEVPEQLKMLRTTRHPLGQMQACWCESGETYRDCHLRDKWDKPCGCGSDRAFQECHMVPTSSQVGVIAV